MNALIFLVPEDIVDVRPRLVSQHCHDTTLRLLTCRPDHDLCRQFDVARAPAGIKWISEESLPDATPVPWFCTNCIMNNETWF